jgi:hypothetical protein
MFLFLLGLLTGFVEQQFNKPRMGLCVAVAAKDVRHLKSLAHSRRSIGRDHPEREAIERARRAGDQIRRDLRVARRRREVGMAEQNLDDANVGASRQEMSAKLCRNAWAVTGLLILARLRAKASAYTTLAALKAFFPMSCRSKVSS